MAAKELEDEREGHKKTHSLMTDYLSQLKEQQEENTKLHERVESLLVRIDELG